MTIASTPPPLDVFVCYAPEDAWLRAELATHLASLRRQGLIIEHDQRVSPGEDRELAMDQLLASARIILLLISSDFLTSNFCYNVQRRALESREKEGVRVIPILVRQCDLTNEPFEKLECLPSNKIPVTVWSSRDLAWTDVARGIRVAVKELQQPPVKAPTAIKAEPVEPAHISEEAVTTKDAEALPKPLTFDSLPETQLYFSPWPSLEGPLSFSSLPATRLIFFPWNDIKS